MAISIFITFYCVVAYIFITDTLTFGLFRLHRYEESYFAVFFRLCQPEARIMISCFLMAMRSGEWKLRRFAITDKPIFSVGQKSFYLNYPIRSNTSEWVAVAIGKCMEPCDNFKAILYTGSHDMHLNFNKKNNAHETQRI